jgi:hypothetical protein
MALNADKQYITHINGGATKPTARTDTKESIRELMHMKAVALTADAVIHASQWRHRGV